VRVVEPETHPRVFGALERPNGSAHCRAVVAGLVVIGMLVACGSSRNVDHGAETSAAAAPPSKPGSTELAPAKPGEPGLANAVPAKPTEPGPARAVAKGMRKYNITPIGDTAPISIEVAIPSDWIEDASSPEGPEFQIPGVEVRVLTINALLIRGDAEARMAKAIRMQYADGADAERRDLSGGRVWMVRREKVVDHARMFVPYDEGVVMGVAILTHASADRLPAIQQAFDTITVPTAH
jgi:hypothetical protein